jgi:hypothetical protein
MDNKVELEILYHIDLAILYRIGLLLYHIGLFLYHIGLLLYHIGLVILYHTGLDMDYIVDRVGLVLSSYLLVLPLHFG